MKLVIKRLGKIKSATLDLRPITIIVGENNTNKSWTAYSAYTLLSALSRNGSRQIIPRITNQHLIKHINVLAAQSSSRMDSVPLGTSVSLEFSRKEILEPINSDLNLIIGPPELTKVLSAPKELLKGASVQLHVRRDELDEGTKFFFLSRAKDGALFTADSDEPYGNKVPSWDSTDIRTLLRRKFKFISINFGVQERDNWEQLIQSVLLDFTLGTLGTVVALPAERKALVNLFKSINDETINQLPVPLQDFIQTLRLAESNAQYDVSPTIRSKALNRLYSSVEGVLGGKVGFKKSSVGERLTFSPRQNVSLPIQAASSIVRSLTGLTIALQQFTQSKNVLVIDEPEMNAHPNAQLAMVEILCALANLGNYVIITTHSPYVVDHLNNLLAAGELKGVKRGQAAKKFMLHMKESFLKPEMVSAYEISPQGKINSLMDLQRNRLSTLTFGNVSSVLENLYSDLLAMGHQ